MKVYHKIKDFLFLDIETVREHPDYDTLLKHRSGDNWERVAKRHMTDESLTPAQAYEKKAALYVEYGKIVSFCWGKFDSEFKMQIGAISDPSEKALLMKVADFFEKLNNKYPETILCGHNIKEFDLPYLVKRMIYHKIMIPTILKNYMSCKPWEQSATDTLYDWRMAGNRFMSLDSIAEFLDIGSSKKGAVSGETLGEYYWNDPTPIDTKITAINDYCKADIRVTMELAKRFYDVL